MKARLSLFPTACALALCTLLSGHAAAADSPLRLLGRTDITGYEGDFDHFAADVAGNRLFLAGEEQGTVEVFDLRSGARLRTITGLESPHAIHYVAASNRLIVTDSGNSMTKILDTRSYAVTGTIELTPGADVMSYDPSTGHLWIVTGGKNAATRMDRTVLYELDARTGNRVGEVSFDSDFTEGVAAEQKGGRVFVNVAGKSEVAVVDKKTRRIVATWPIAEGQNNAPIGLDEPRHQLFVVTRKPFKLVVLDTKTGRSVASFEAPQRTNELLFDRPHGRIYLTGDDYVAVFKRSEAGDYKEIARVPSDKGAKTAIYVPEIHRLYVAVAGKAPTRAALLQYDVISDPDGQRPGHQP
jgi:DNA-binding beta-propeller fold protein YncE